MLWLSNWVCVAVQCRVCIRRCLKPGMPPDTVDVNETRYRALVRLYLDPFMEPGVCSEGERRLP